MGRRRPVGARRRGAPRPSTASPSTPLPETRRAKAVQASAGESFDREAVKDRMIRDLGGKYQWRSIRLIALMNFPFIRWLKATPAVRQRIEQASHKTAGGICSQFIARCFGEDELSFVRKHYSVTTPNDLARSPKLDYLGTLV